MFCVYFYFKKREAYAYFRRRKKSQKRQKKEKECIVDLSLPKTYFILDTETFLI